MIVLGSDPHIGVNRRSNTTANSRKLLRKRILANCFALVDTANNLNAGKILTGDLFDTESNDEATIIEGINFVRELDFVLAGNHDLPNRDGVSSSLQVVDQALGSDGTVAIAKVGEVKIIQGELAGVNVTAIPHHATQELFDKAIQKALDNPIGGIVLLHCNVESPFPSDDASLNISLAQAQTLLDVGYQVIFNGHEHNFSTHLGGKLISLGCLYPTSFGDVETDKFIWSVDANMQVSKYKVWDSGTKYKCVEVTDEMVASKTLLSLPEELEFIRLQGKISAENFPEFAVQVTNLWELRESTLVMCKVETQAVEDIRGVPTESSGSIIDLSKQIGEDLKDSPMYELWSTYLQEVLHEA